MLQYWCPWVSSSHSPLQLIIPPLVCTTLAIINAGGQEWRPSTEEYTKIAYHDDLKIGAYCPLCRCTLILGRTRVSCAVSSEESGFCLLSSFSWPPPSLPLSFTSGVLFVSLDLLQALKFRQKNEQKGESSDKKGQERLGYTYKPNDSSSLEKI